MNDEIKEMTKVLKSLGNKQANELYYYITYLEEELEEEKRINQEDLKLIDELNERIEKAVEYIKEQYKWIEESDKRWQPVLDNKKILNILNGRSDK